MARCLLTTLWIGRDDPVFAPLTADGHEVVPVDGLAVRSEPALIDALQGMAASLASTEPYTAAVLAEAPDLRVISRTGVGYDAIDVPKPRVVESSCAPRQARTSTPSPTWRLV
jgi:phosphoglycerate dehydrogenase-like enzyme